MPHPIRPSALFIDDDPAAINDFKNELDRLHWAVTILHTDVPAGQYAARAIEYFRARPAPPLPDLVILDMRMPLPDAPRGMQPQPEAGIYVFGEIAGINRELKRLGKMAAITPIAILSQYPESSYRPAVERIVGEGSDWCPYKVFDKAKGAADIAGALHAWFGTIHTKRTIFARVGAYFARTGPP